MKIVKKILSWVFIIALILPNIILLKYFVDSAFQPTRDMYAIPITIMLCALILLKTIELLPKFKAPKKKLKIVDIEDANTESNDPAAPSLESRLQTAFSNDKIKVLLNESQDNLNVKEI